MYDRGNLENAVKQFGIVRVVNGQAEYVEAVW